MKYAEGKIGRVFVLRLADGDRVPECIEEFASEKGIKRAYCSLLGGIGKGRVIVGPEDGSAVPVVPMLHELEGVHEVAAVGTIFPSEDGASRLHMHAALGREGNTRTGCVRAGVEVWKIGEVVIFEILGTDMLRRKDPETGFEMLDS